MELVEEVVEACGRSLRLLRPPDAEALIDERAFERDEFLPYWAELWPSARALAGALCGKTLRGTRVLELGCGLGVPSLTAAALGATVLATDWAEDAVALVRRNAARNDLPVAAAVLAWERAEELPPGGPWQLVLAADVLYERRNVEPLLHLLRRLVAPGGEALVADPTRPAAAAFLEQAAAEWDVSSTADPLRPRMNVHRLRRRRDA